MPRLPRLPIALSSGCILGLCGFSINQAQESPRILVPYTPPPQYSRIDSILEDAHPEWKSNNAFHGTLQGENMIEGYEVYANSEAGDIICLVRYGKSLNGHSGVVHGGITALTFDNSFGWLFIANKTPPAFTANISVNYRRKIPESTMVILRARISEFQGRKIFMVGTIEDLEGNILADSTSLFITIKDAAHHGEFFKKGNPSLGLAPRSD